MCRGCTLKWQCLSRSTPGKDNQTLDTRRAVSLPRPPSTLTFMPSTRSYRPTNGFPQDDLYAFPPLEICLWHGMGCDEKFPLHKCVADASATVYVTGNETGKDIEFKSKVRVHQHYRFNLLCGKRWTHYQTLARVSGSRTSCTVSM